MAAAFFVALALAVVVCVSLWQSLWQTPTYEASARVLVDFREYNDSRPRLIPNPAAPPPQLAQKVVPIDSRPVAKEAIRRLRLRMSPNELLDNLTVQHVEPSRSIRSIGLSYADIHPKRAEEVVNTVGRVAAERITEADVEKLGGSTDLTATVDEATVPDTPASPQPLRNGLIALVVGLVLVSVVGILKARRTA